MEDKEFDKLTPEEKKARFQKALDDYNSGFVEVDYTLRSVASIPFRIPHLHFLRFLPVTSHGLRPRFTSSQLSLLRSVVLHSFSFPPKSFL